MVSLTIVMIPLLFDLCALYNLSFLKSDVAFKRAKNNSLN